MKDSEIIEIIQEFHRDFADEDKISGTSKYTFLCLYIKRQEFRIQQEFMSFFIREIRNNKYGLLYDALAGLRQMNDKEVIPQLFEIFVEYYKSDKDCKDIFLLLMRLGDTVTEHIDTYANYVHKKLVPHSAYYSAYIIDYINVNPKDAVLILSDLYMNLLAKEQVLSWNNMYIFTLVHYFINKDLLPLFQLINLIYDKNQTIGELMKSLLLQYVTFSPCYSKEEYEQKQNMKQQLQSHNHH